MTASSSIHFTNKEIRLTQLRLKFTRKGQIMHFETLQVTLISADTFISNVLKCQFKNLLCIDFTVVMRFLRFQPLKFPKF